MATREELKQVFANGQMATGEKFANLIDSMKVVQLPVVDPQALGTSLSFIDSITQDEDGKITVTKKRMSPTVGSFQFVANDATAEAALTTVGATYNSAISGVSPSEDTLGVILLMNDDDTTPTKTMMITTQEITPATTPATYQFVYVGDLQSALLSGVLKTADIVNNLTDGGNDKVLSAEAGKEMYGEVFGRSVSDEESIELSPGVYKTSSVVVGESYIGSISNTSSIRKYFKCKKVTVNVGESYVAVHRGGNDALRYVKVDANDIVLEVAEAGFTLTTDTFAATNETGAFTLYLNFYTSSENDWTGQSLTKITTVYNGGAINEVKAKTKYIECETLGDVSTKEVILSNYVLEADIRLIIKFTHANTADNVTLNINNTGAKGMMLNGSPVGEDNSWGDGDELDIYYDGSYYQCRVMGVAEGVEELREEVLGIPIENSEDITSSLTGGYYNTTSAVVGNTYIKEIASSTRIRKNHKGKKIIVNPGETYIAVHKPGYTAAVRSYVKTDLNDIVTGIGIFQTSADTVITEIFTNESNVSYNLYLNFYTSIENDWTGQSLTKVSTEYIGGAINEAKDELEGEIMENTKFLNGKIILCLGDSVTEFSGTDGKRYSDWLAEISKATVINGGVGGSQYRRHAATSGYGGMDVISIVKAIVSGSFPSIPEVGVMQYEGQVEDRVLSGVTSVAVGEKTSDEATRYPDHTKLEVTIDEITFSLMVYTYSLNGTTLFYNSDYEGYLTTNEWKTLITSAENVKFTSNDDNRATVRRLEDIDFSQLYAITLFAGANDWLLGDASSVGTSGTESDTTTLGAINKIIRLLCETYPNVRVYFFTPIIKYRANTNTEENWSDNYVPATGMNLRDFSALIFNEVQLNHIPVCDMYNTLGWNQYNFLNFFNSTDSSHPYKGFKWIAERMYEFLVSRSNVFGTDTLLGKKVTENIADISAIKVFLDNEFPGWNNG